MIRESRPNPAWNFSLFGDWLRFAAAFVVVVVEIGLFDSRVVCGDGGYRIWEFWKVLLKV
jgi:hypothetical protein